EEHVDNCDPCRSALREGRRFLTEVRGAGPLYRAPARLRERIQTLVGDDFAEVLNQSHGEELNSCVHVEDPASTACCPEN
ncbi:MAG TPA: hypothetical protein VJX67_05700, partial [Blastocatellia bacterium]|nr:hypothetical protein [Blastocatellia bacterium]